MCIDPCACDPVHPRASADILALSSCENIVLSFSMHQVLLADMYLIGSATVTPEFEHNVSQSCAEHPKNPAGADAGYSVATFSVFEIPASAYDVHVDVSPASPPQLFSFVSSMQAVTQ